MYSDGDTPKGWVAPFRYPRINACSRLPVAFRSVPRLSSPPGAKASTECPSHAREHRTIHPRISPGIMAQTIMYRNHPHQHDDPHHRVHTDTLHTTLETQLAHTDTTASQPPRPQNASEHICRRSLGCIPPGVATQPDLGRSDFAIPVSPRRGLTRGRHPFARTSHQTARPETHQNLIHNSKEQMPGQPPPGSARHHQPSQKPLRSEVTPAIAEYAIFSATRPPRQWQGNGGERVRTDDPLLAKQVLSQLSYTPANPPGTHKSQNPGAASLVGQGGFEPPTPRLSSVCSNQLSY
jgi:hypothetical protein